MKLLHRITIAFGLLLLVVTGVTANFIHSLLLDNLIEQQRKELRQKGQWWVQQIQQQHREITTKDYEDLSQLLSTNNKVDILAMGKRRKVMYTTLPATSLREWVAELQAGKEKKERRGVWTVAKDDFIVVMVPLGTDENQRLLLASPIRGIKEIRIELTKKVLVILFIGAIFAFILGFFITRGMVGPLTRLRKELKKVQMRNFSEVKLIPAEGEIGDVTKSVYYLAQELDHYQQVQKQFFQNASHELKTPLMSIQGYAEGIRDGIFADEEAKQGLDVIVQEASRLKDIVTEMILLAKLESEEGIFHPAEVLVPKVVDQVIERLNPLLLRNHIQATVQVNSSIPLVNIDHDKFLQALLNIMSNALRHAKEQIDIRISAQDRQVIIEIQDDGDGISQELLPTLFHRFVKGKDGETGLGLAISRAIIERSGGTIQAANSKEGGACFQIKLPAEG